MLKLLSDAALSARFEKLLSEMRAANRIQPRTVASIGKAKALAVKLTEITAEMRRRSGELSNPVNVAVKVNNDIAEQIVGSIAKTLGGVGKVGAAAGDAAGQAIGAAVKASGVGFWLVVAGAGLAAVYILKK